LGEGDEKETGKDVDGGHFALDTAADSIAQLVRGFLQ
jgi:hypothetical protein